MLAPILRCCTCSLLTHRASRLTTFGIGTKAKSLSSSMASARAQGCAKSRAMELENSNDNLGACIVSLTVFDCTQKETEGFRTASSCNVTGH